MAEELRKTLTILRRRQLEIKIGLSRSTIYEMMAAGLLPRPITIGRRAVGWQLHEIDAWIAARAADSRRRRPPTKVRGTPAPGAGRHQAVG